MRLALLHQAIGMAAMIWMVYAVAAPAGSPASGMAGTKMSGLATGGAAFAGTGVAASAVTLALAGYLGVAALWWLRRARLIVVQGPSQTAASGWLSPTAGAVVGTAGDAACQAVLAAAAVVLLTRML